MDAETVAKVANELRPSERKAMLTKDGSGDFSTATFVRLTNKGLIERSLRFTDMGLAVRALLKGE